MAFSAVIAIIWSLLVNCSYVPFLLLLLISIFFFVSIYISNNKFKILDMMLPIYKTNNGIQMIKINNTFYNIYDTNNINKIKDQLLLDKKYESEYIFI